MSNSLGLFYALRLGNHVYCTSFIFTFFVSMFLKSFSLEVRALATVFEKSATELKDKKNFTKCKNTIQIAIFNVRNLNRIGLQLS